MAAVYKTALLSPISSLTCLLLPSAAMLDLDRKTCSLYMEFTVSAINLLGFLLL